METIGEKNGQIAYCVAVGRGPELRLSHLKSLLFLSFARLNLSQNQFAKRSRKVICELNPIQGWLSKIVEGRKTIGQRPRQMVSFGTV